VSDRSDKPSATSANVRRILSTPTRPLTAKEKKARTSFYEGGRHDAVAVEPSGDYGAPRG